MTSGSQKTKKNWNLWSGTGLMNFLKFIKKKWNVGASLFNLLYPSFFNKAFCWDRIVMWHTHETCFKPVLFYFNLGWHLLPDLLFRSLWLSIEICWSWWHFNHQRGQRPLKLSSLWWGCFRGWKGGFQVRGHSQMTSCKFGQFLTPPPPLSRAYALLSQNNLPPPLFAKLLLWMTPNYFATAGTTGTFC